MNTIFDEHTREIRVSVSLTIAYSYDGKPQITSLLGFVLIKLTFIINYEAYSC